MPKIYRVMKKDADDKPVVGTGSSVLGVRPHDMADNPPGAAHPGKGGLSVQPSLEALAEYRNFVPKRLAENNPRLFRGAAGSNTPSIINMGEGPFVDGLVTADLALRCDADRQPVVHGVVEPARVMSLPDFQSALAATRDQWAWDKSVEKTQRESES